MLTDDTGVYAIENLYNGRVYVGATRHSFRYRWNAHFILLNQRKHVNPGLNVDVKRYGACAFRLVVLQVLPRTIPFQPFEQAWMDYFRALGLQCYNVMPASDTHLCHVLPSAIPAEYRYTLHQVKARLGISEGTIYGRLKVLPSVGRQSYRRWHFSEADILVLKADRDARRLRRRERHAVAMVLLKARRAGGHS